MFPRGGKERERDKERGGERESFVCVAGQGSKERGGGEGPQVRVWRETCPTSTVDSSSSEEHYVAMETTQGKSTEELVEMAHKYDSIYLHQVGLRN